MRRFLLPSVAAFIIVNAQLCFAQEGGKETPVYMPIEIKIIDKGLYSQSMEKVPEVVKKYEEL